MSLKNCLQTLMRQQDLSKQQCQQLMQSIFNEEADPIQLAAILVLLRTKKETAEELSEMALYLQKYMVPLVTPHRILDIVGTGGDQANTVNISTGSAILAASCGVKVAKHGNRAASSMTGSADVLEALGISIHASPENISASIDQIGIGFCFAPNFHPLLQKIRPLRQQLQVPTTFNLLGPLLNPARPAHVLLGVYHADLINPLGLALQKMGTLHSIVTHSQGLDELSCLGSAQGLEIKSSDLQLREEFIDPKQFGFDYCSLQDLQGKDAKTNARLLRNALTPSNYAQSKPLSDTLILNAGIATYLYGKYPTMTEAIEFAREQLFCGASLTLLNNWIEFSHD